MSASRSLQRGGYVALTGVPGTGKSSVGEILAGTRPVVEVSDLALSTHTGRRVGAAVEIDLDGLGRWISHQPPRTPRTILVGHLAHLLPVRDVVLLRCHPNELAARLVRARRGTRHERSENFAAEAIDVILGESLALKRRVWEFDTTGRTPRAVARDVDRRLRHPSAPSYGAIDWLSDPRVTAGLLAPPR